MSYKIVWSDIALLDLAAVKRIGDKAISRKLVRLLDEISQHPRTGTGQVKQLKHGYSGCWSRRLNDVDRIVYEIDDDNMTVNIVSTKDHYKY